MGSSTEAESRLNVVVSEDRLKAWVQLSDTPPEGADPLAVEHVIGALEQENVAVTDAVRQRVEELVAGRAEPPDTEQGGGPPGGLLVAEGRAAVEAEDGVLEWSAELLERFAPPSDDERIDYFKVSTIVTVAAGTLIGQVRPPKDGTPSLDVFGTERPGRKPKGAPLKLGPGVRLAEEGSADLVAEQDGRVVYERGQVRICEVLEIPGDVDFDSGSIEACVDVVVHGTVRANFCVHTSKSLSVDRLIEAAEVDVGGELTVRGGVFGREAMSRMRVRGNVSAQFLNELGLDAGGDVHFIKEILNSQVSAQGHLVGERGTIIGGETYAREGIDVRVIGSEAGVTTVVAVGTALDVLRRVWQMERVVVELQKSVEKVRSAVQPLLADLKRLLPEQRQRATELLCKADELESQVDDTQQEAQRILREAAPRGHPFVRAQDVIYPGVRIRIGVREVYLKKLIHGPVKVELRKVQHVTEVVAVNQRTGSLTVLPSTEADLDTPPTDQAKGQCKDGADELAAQDRRALPDRSCQRRPG